MWVCDDYNTPNQALPCSPVLVSAMLGGGRLQSSTSVGPLCSWHPAICMYPNLPVVVFVCTSMLFISILPGVVWLVRTRPAFWRVVTIQPSAVMIWSNLSYYIRHCNDNSRHKSYLKFRTDTPYLALTGSYEVSVVRILRYNVTWLHSFGSSKSDLCS